MEDEGSLIVNGIRVDPDVLRKDFVQPCATAKCMAECCAGGVWLKADEVPRIRKWAGAIKACLPPDRHEESTWFTSEPPEEDQPREQEGTTTVEDPLRPGQRCCVFLQQDRKCALQVVSQANHLGNPGLKPYFCAIYPLYFEAGLLSMDETRLESEGAACHRSAQQKGAMYEVYREEAILILGEEGYRDLCQKAAARKR